MYCMCMKAFGDRLRELRLARGLTQKQLGAILCVSSNTVHSWESDKQEPSMCMLLTIGEYFDVTLDYLFGRSDY